MMPDCPGRNEAVGALRAVCQVSTPPREMTAGARSSRIPRLRPCGNVRANAIEAASPDSAGTSGSGSGV